MKKRLLAGLLAAMMVVSMMSTIASAAERELSADEPEVHCVTLNAADLLAYEQTATQRVTPSLSLSGGSNWSAPVTANFSTIPVGATVVKVRVTPGKMSYSGPITSAIGVSTFKLTAPDGTSVDLGFSTMWMETSALSGLIARGSWKLSIYGTHAGAGFGTIKYTNTEIKIWYTV